MGRSDNYYIQISALRKELEALKIENSNLIRERNNYRDINRLQKDIIAKQQKELAEYQDE